MSHPPSPTWYVALAIVRKGDAFLLVQERDGSWFFPAGRVDPGEGLIDGAKREAMEEAGVPIRVTGLLRIEHRPTPRARQLFY